MTFHARFEGRCGACRGAIEVGALVEYVDDTLVHAGEVPVDAAPGLRHGEEVCLNCFLVKPCECEDS